MGLRQEQGGTADRYFLVGISQIGLLQGNHGDHIWFTKSEDLPGNRNKTGKPAALSGISPGHGANPRRFRATESQLTWIRVERPGVFS